MMKKKIAAVLTTVSLCMGFVGCAKNEIPDMTDEQMKAMGEYVAITMMKYDANHRSRLVDLSEIAPKQKPSPEPTSTPEPSPEPSREPSGMGPVDNTLVIDMPGNNSWSMEEALALQEGVSLVYSGQEICASYPNDKDSLVSLNAAKGKKLLVLKYLLVNSGEQEQEIDILSGEASFRVTVNGDYSKVALRTWMPGDLCTFKDRIPGNSSREVVLLLEVSEEMASSISSISLTVKNGEKIYTAQLL